ncbi:uncharacterized protein RCO7_02753 [Rhynchosporium graminicola]|uniref:ATPase AAA-type core domain-containing protein n=1 Tax=Rhynchosporium graminicola TaxID=2792576 RepID=A0A1E1KSZ7_9HELO|nr:uncharacterized protein RCO7_02753 [Rhynchosporium commune]
MCFLVTFETLARSQHADLHRTHQKHSHTSIALFPQEVTQETQTKTSPIFSKFSDLTSAKLSNLALQLLEELRPKYPEHVVTYADPSSLNLLSFAYAGNATATLDLGTESGVSDEMRAWTQPPGREKRGCLAEARGFAKYKYRWGQEYFILYRVVVGYSNTQFVLKEAGPGVTRSSPSREADTLLAQVGHWVILDPGLKEELKSVSSRFFNSKDVYADLGVPWKRGLIFYGPAGNGKTISIKALMHTLADHKDSIPTLYYISSYGPYQIRIRPRSHNEPMSPDT